MYFWPYAKQNQAEVWPRFWMMFNWIVVIWICQNQYMDFSKLLHGSVRIDAWISLSCYMDLSKLLYGFFKVVTRICQSCFMYVFHALWQTNLADQDQDFEACWSFCYILTQYYQLPTSSAPFPKVYFWQNPGFLVNSV